MFLGCQRSSDMEQQSGTRMISIDQEYFYQHSINAKIKKLGDLQDALRARIDDQINQSTKTNYTLMTLQDKITSMQYHIEELEDSIPKQVKGETSDYHIGSM